MSIIIIYFFFFLKIFFFFFLFFLCGEEEKKKLKKVADFLNKNRIDYLTAVPFAVAQFNLFIVVKKE